MDRQARYQALIDHFQVAMPEATTQLRYTTPFELLVAVILSAQCTDKRVNQVTPSLFRDYPHADAMAKGSIKALLPYINSITYPKSKARYLLESAKMISTTFGGKLPAARASLTQLPGVGRKTANVVLSVIYGQPVMAVDTHVMRLAHRLGLVAPSDKSPLAIEKRLVTYFPRALVAKAHHWLILHGRYICTARKPQCHRCKITSCCDFFKKKRMGPSPV